MPENAPGAPRAPVPPSRHSPKHTSAPPRRRRWPRGCRSLWTRLTQNAPVSNWR